MGDKRKVMYQYLLDVGFSSKEAQTMRSWSKERIDNEIKQRKERTKRDARNAKMRERTKLFNELGIPAKDRPRLRNASEQTIREMMDTKAAPPKQNNQVWGDKIVLLFKDIAEDGRVDEDIIKEWKAEKRKQSTEYVTQTIAAGIFNQGIMIGEIEIIVTNEPEKLVRHSTGYDRYGIWRNHLHLWTGTGAQYKKMLDALAVGMILVYDSFVKLLFITNFYHALAAVNLKAAKRLRTDLEKLGVTF